MMIGQSGTYAEYRAQMPERLKQAGLSEASIARSTEPCSCGHVRGDHSTAMHGRCVVGSPGWNHRNKLNLEPCSCPRVEQVVDAIAEAVELEARKSAAEFWCEACGDQAEPTAKYACGNCGTEFTYADEGTHRCPDCGKFAAKMDGDFCSSCGEEL